MIPPAQYPDDGMAKLLSYVSQVVDFRFNMKDHRLRDDVVSHALYVLARGFHNHPDKFTRNKSAVRYAVLNSIRANGLSRHSTHSSRFWITDTIMESDTMAQIDDDESSTIFDTIPAPIPYAEIARRELEGLCRLLTGKDLAVYRLMIDGASSRDIARQFNVCMETARHWTESIVAALRKRTKEEYDHAQSAINVLHSERGARAALSENMDDTDDSAARTGGGSPANRHEPVIGRKGRIPIARHPHRRDPAVVRTQNDYNRPRVRLEGGAGVAALRDLGLMRKSA
jgi:hypothetical protein